jgi:hypothetical protein
MREHCAMTRDITVTVSIEALATSTAVSVVVADGSEHDRANVGADGHGSS